MSVEEELKKDHADMQAIVDSKQKIIEAQVNMRYKSARLHSLELVFNLVSTWAQRQHLIASEKSLS